MGAPRRGPRLRHACLLFVALAGSFPFQAAAESPGAANHTPSAPSRRPRSSRSDPGKQPGSAPPPLSQPVYQALMRAEALRERGDLDGAVAGLQKVVLRGPPSPYEQAMIRHTLGFVLTEKEDYLKAVDTWTRSLEGDHLPLRVAQATRMALAGVLQETERDVEAVEVLLAWLERETGPAPETRIRIAGLEASLERWEAARRHSREALDRNPEAPETWWTLHAGILQRSGDLAATQGALEERLEHFPTSRQAWLQLAGILDARGRHPQALALLTLGETQGVLVEPRDRIRLARTRLYQDLPYLAARELEAEVRKGTLPRSPEVSRILADSWERAGEWARAAASLGRVLEARFERALADRRLRLLLQLEDWGEVEDFARNCLERDLEEPGPYWIARGRAALESRPAQPEQAALAFTRAAEDPGSADRARAWGAYLTAQQASELDTAPGGARPGGHQSDSPSAPEEADSEEDGPADQVQDGPPEEGAPPRQ